MQDARHRVPLAALTVAVLTLALLIASADAASALPPGVGYAPITRTLTVTLADGGGVTSNVTGPEGVSCPGDCQGTSTQVVYCTDECAPADPNAWTTFVLTATNPPDGDSPVWTGCDSVSGDACSVYLDTDRSVTLSWVDTAAPSVALGVNAIGGRVGPTATVSATAADNVGVREVDWFIGLEHGTPALADTTAPYGGTIDLSSLDDGTTVTIWAQATDVNGLRSGFVSQAVTLDLHVGLALGSITGPDAAQRGFTNAATVPMSVATDPDATTVCSVSGAVTIAPAACSGTFSPVSAASPDGAYTYTVTATDDIGNATTGTRSFTLDRTPPVITAFGGPPEGGRVSSDSVTFTFAPTDANLASVDCTLDATAVPCSSSASLTGLADGTHHFTVVATDKAGNQAARTSMFAVQKVVAGPTPAPRKPGANPARLVSSFSIKRGVTRFPVLRLERVGKGSKITLACSGKGCPKLRPLRTSGTVRLTALTRPGFKPGTVITITITTPGRRTKTVTITVRKGAPKIR